MRNSYFFRQLLFLVLWGFSFFADEKLTDVGSLVERLAIDGLLRFDDRRKVNLTNSSQTKQREKYLAKEAVGHKYIWRPLMRIQHKYKYARLF